jgi:hypothetical protein
VTDDRLRRDDDRRADQSFLVVDLDAVKVPYLFVLAKEDNSITELGNLLLRRNYSGWRPRRLVELADAGTGRCPICRARRHVRCRAAKELRRRRAFRSPTSIPVARSDRRCGRRVLHEFLLGDDGGDSSTDERAGARHRRAHDALGDEAPAGSRAIGRSTDQGFRGRTRVSMHARVRSVRLDGCVGSRVGVRWAELVSTAPGAGWQAGQT